MNVLVASSPAPCAHPPRSKPFLRSSSVAPPLLCLTPSTVTCVMVVSLMTALPFSVGRTWWAASPPYYERPRADPTPPSLFLSRTFRHACSQRSDRTKVSGRLSARASCPDGADRLRDRPDRERSGGATARTAAAGTLTGRVSR